MDVRDICGLECVNASCICIEETGSAWVNDVVRVDRHALLLVLSKQTFAARAFLLQG